LISEIISQCPKRKKFLKLRKKYEAQGDDAYKEADEKKNWKSKDDLGKDKEMLESLELGIGVSLRYIDIGNG
jgi:hypothetical protein